MKSILLASQSPRRKQLLEQAGIVFTTLSISSDESYPTNLKGGEVPAFIARNKANAAWKSLSEKDQENALLIAADTVVVLEDKIIGKPQEEKDAFRILRSLSGKQHAVFSAVILKSKEQSILLLEKTEVFFKELNDDQIQYYIENYHPFDKAGAYAIQEWIGLIGIEKINGDYYNVMGLPIHKVVEALNHFA